MTRLVVATQRIDPLHPALAATVPKLAALAARVDELVVLCDSAVPDLLPPNVRVHVFGGGRRLGRGVRFETALAGELRHGRAPVLAHMIPRYAVLAAPLVRPLGRPLLLWYTHWNATGELRLATRLATTILSADAESFPLETPKLIPIGHGIDVSRFDRAHPTEDSRLRVVALGRMSPMKRYPTLLRAVRLAVDAGADLDVTIRGPSLTAEERSHRLEVEAEVLRLGLADRVRIGDAIAWTEVPGALAGADVLANLAEAADKIVYEAAATRTLPVASAPAFATLLPDELRFRRDDAEALAVRLGAVAAMPAPERLALGDVLRARVVSSHSVDTWAAAVVAAALRHDS